MRKELTKCSTNITNISSSVSDILPKIDIGYFRRILWDNSSKRFNINTENLTFNITNGTEMTMVTGYKTPPIILLADAELSCPLYDSSNPTSYCGIVIDSSTKTIKAKPAVNRYLFGENEYLLAIVRTTYGDSKKFTSVDWVGGPIYIDGVLYNNWKDSVDRIISLENKIQTLPIPITPSGEYYGEPIQLKRKFKETYIGTISVSQSNLFDKTLYSVGNQGSDIYNDEFVVFARLGTLRENESVQKYGICIANAKTNTLEGEFIVDSLTTRAHGNNLNLGRKFNEADKYPLVYVSDSYAPYYCNVLRVNDNAAGYNVVQRIRYVGELTTTSPQTIDYILDIENGNLYVAASYFGGSNKHMTFKKYPLPSVDIEEVELDDDSALESFTIDNLKIAQGAKIVGNRLYIGLGYNTNDEWLKVVDLQRKCIITTIPLSYEPEGMGVYNNKIAVISGGFFFYTYEDC